MSSAPDSGLPAALRSVTRGVGAKFVGMAAGRVLALATNILLTRTLGASLYGIYSFANTLMSVGAIITNLGTDQSITRFIPGYENKDHQNRVIGLATGTSFVASVVVGVSLYVLAPTLSRLTLDQPLLVDALRIFAVILPFRTLTGCVASVFRAVELPGYQVLTSDIAYHVFRLLAVAVAVAVGAAFVGVVAAIVAGAAFTFLFGVGLFISRTNFRPTIRGERPGTREFYNFSVPLTLSDVGGMLQNKVDILMVGLFLSGRAVGIYNISAVLTQALRMPLIGFNTMFPPIAARMYSNGEHADLEALFARVTRWSFTLSFFPSIALVVYSDEVLSIFGPGFAAGSTVLSIFVVAQMTSAAVGPSGYVLMMTDHQYLAAIDEWALGISNTVLNYLFITQFGLIGAAVATAGTLASINLLRVAQVWYTERLLPFSTKFYKPVVAGIVSGPLMIGIHLLTPVSGFLLLVGGTLAGLLAYGGVLYLVGIEPEDREFFAEFVN